MAFIYVLVYICLFNGLFAKVLNVTQPVILEKPKGKDEIIIAAEIDFNLTCQGKGPLKWTFPKVDEETILNKIETRFTTTNSTINDNDEFTHKSILHIKKITYPFVGYYTCHYSDEDEPLSDTIYIYVNDTEHLSVEDNYKIYYAVQYEPVTIPCRPTSPDIQVELVDGNKIETQYNPKVGFTFSVDDVRYQDNYFCNFSRLKDLKVFTQTIFLYVTTPRSSLAIPYIEDTFNNHTEVGGTLILKCYLQEEGTSISFEWIIPRGRFERKMSTVFENGKKYLVSNITIQNVTKADSGIYTCKVYDRQNHTNINSVPIYIQDKNSCFIHFSGIQSDQKILSIEEGESVQWVIKVIAHPSPELKWFNNEDKEIKNSSISQYTIQKLEDNHILFKINNATLENNGSYTVRGRCSQEERHNPHSKTELRLTLIVSTRPKVTLESHKIYLENTPVQVSCTTVSNPVSIITWQYMECINGTQSCQEVKINATSQTKGFKRTSNITITPKHKGNLTCSADNALGSRNETALIYTSDVKDGFDMYNFDVDITVKKKGNAVFAFIAKNYTLKFTCAVSPYKAKNLQIFHNNILINDAAIEVKTKADRMSVKTTVYLRGASTNDSGVYSCRIQNNDNRKYEFKNVTVIVQDPAPPKILGTNLQDIINIEYPTMPTKLYCNYTGVPKVSIEWYKNDEIIIANDRIVFEEDKSIMKFTSTVVSDEGHYKCRTYNDIGQVWKRAELKFKVKPVSLARYYYSIGIVLVLLTGAIIYIVIKKWKEKKLMEELKRLGLENFHKGNPEHINPELGIDDQAELLPYDKKWEFPIAHLKLGKQLGSGAFGVVMKAEARGITDGEEKTTVAVKMVKKNADQTYIKALASELKVMVHLGKHINVVNLLGACTENVAKKELLVIVEFCRFGNLQNYLFKHRESFINQVDPRTGTIDCNIGSQILDRLYSVSSDNGSTITTPYSMQDYREKERNATATIPTQVTSIGEDQVTLSNNSIQPEWRSNYRGDYRGDVKPVSTTDLITWSFQIARGMEYLASRKVLHGDLAARNILLADKNVVKICDFGLAKSMYKDNNYKKKGNSPLPIKWMAIESIRDRVFSTQSDVWSFGIVLWELFSLAKTPYPGMEADERLYYKLVEGYRMESPVYTPKIIYGIMEDCWQSKPLARPSFTTLVERIGNLLENSVRRHYIELNDPYLMMNTQKIEGEDYLAMVSPPSFDLLSAPSPHYVNEGVAQVSPGVRSPEGYTFMGANTIFSPRLQESGVFDFNMVNKRNGNNSSNEYPELHPMLYHSNESDTESGYLRPNTPINSISNPTYHLPPVLDAEKDLLKSPDNYITMPQYKNIVMNNKSAPVQIDVTKDNQKAHYVNNDAAMWDAINV